MAQTKADRKAAAKKAAATRERNKTKAESQRRGDKAAATRQSNMAAESLNQAKRAAGSAAGGLFSAAKSVGGAAKQALLSRGLGGIERARARTSVTRPA